MSDIKQAIKQVRPKLREIAPLTYALVKGFAIFNIVLGMALYVIPYPSESPTLVIINDLFDYRVWGSLFIILGLAKLYVMFKNDWKNMRLALLIAVFFKAIWLFAIIIQILQGEGSLAILVIWSFLTYIQIMLYVHFIPNTHRELLYGFRNR